MMEELLILGIAITILWVLDAPNRDKIHEISEIQKELSEMMREMKG